MKKITRIVIYIILGLAVLIFGLICLSKYAEWKFDREMESLKIEQEKPYLEDTYGGATPKETLDLFIAAVEKEDFDLASKYFVISRQGEWRDVLKNAEQAEKIDDFLKPVKDESDKLKSVEPLWEKAENYVSGDSVLFEFVKYPKGIWKIKEI